MSFFKEWDFYYVPKTDYNPKWVNYKYKNKKFYNHMCKIATALNIKFKCDSGRYNYRSLCYSEDAAMKPEMLNNLDDYHCKSDWNIRDLNLYEVDKASCGCGICCPIKKVSSYDPSIFTPLGTIVKSIKLVCQDKDRVYCAQMNKCFRVTLYLTKMTNWSVLTTLKDIFENKSYTSYDDIAYLNFIGLQMVRFYLMMNVADTSAGKTLAGLGVFSSHVPVFMVFKGSSNEGLTDSATSRDYSLSFYKAGVTADSTPSGNSEYRYRMATIKKDYLVLGGVANPSSNLTFKTIGTQGVFLVSPTHFCQDRASTNKTVAEAMPKYTEGTAILYVVYYKMNDLRLDQNVSVMTDFKSKYIDNPNLVVSPQARAWNEFVYYNHVLPNICYGVETDSSYCDEIRDYNASPPTYVRQNCSLTTSNRFPDCKTYLLTNIGSKQPAVNQTRTYTELDAKQRDHCNRHDTLECQCYNREKHDGFKSFQSTNYAFPVDMKNNAGCWYRPCLDDPQGNIFIESAFRNQFRNCPEAVCQNVITVMNRPENTVNFSNLELRNSCSILSTYTPAPSTTPGLARTVTPEPEDGETMEPPPIPPPLPGEAGSTDDADTSAAADIEQIKLYAGVYVFLFIFLVAGVLIAWPLRPFQQQGSVRRLFRFFFRTLWPLQVVLIGIVSFLVIASVRALRASNAV